MNPGGFAQTAETFGIFGLGQMPAPGAEPHCFARGGDFKPLGHRLLRFDAFGTSHKLFKRTHIIRFWRREAREKRNKLQSGTALSRKKRSHHGYFINTLL
jgi:hypothetical protein